MLVAVDRTPWQSPQIMYCAAASVLSWCRLAFRHVVSLLFKNQNGVRFNAQVHRIADAYVFNGAF